MPRANQYTIIDLIPPRKKIFQTYKNWHLKTLFERKSQARTLPDGWVDEPETLFSPSKKGRLFGESCTSDFVRCIPGNTLLTKALNYYFELNFCRQCISQRQFRICDTCRLNKLPIVSNLRNYFSESPWRGSDRQVEFGKWLHLSEFDKWLSFRHKLLTKSGTRS